MMLNEFEVRSYGWQELAVFYGLDLMPASAGKRLSCPNGWGKPGAKDRATGKRLEERKEDVDSPAGEDDRTISE